MQVNRLAKGWKSGARQPTQVCPNTGRKIEKLVGALRVELAEYGAMLVLLDRQQRYIIALQGEALLENAASIGVRIESLASSRRTRQQLSREIARSLGEPKVPTFNQLVLLVPAKHRTLLSALVDQINFVIFLCQQRLLQNKLLLGRSTADESDRPKPSRLILFGLN